MRIVVPHAPPAVVGASGRGPPLRRAPPAASPAAVEALSVDALGVDSLRDGSVGAELHALARRRAADPKKIVRTDGGSLPRRRGCEGAQPTTSCRSRSSAQTGYAAPYGARLGTMPAQVLGTRWLEEDRSRELGEVRFVDPSAFTRTPRVTARNGRRAASRGAPDSTSASNRS